MEESCKTLKDEIQSKQQLTEELEKAIDEKEAPALVVQERMNRRGMRPDMEMVEDPVQKALYEEWRDITKGIYDLKEKHKKSLEDTAKFRKQLESIQTDLMVKVEFLQCEEDVYSMQVSWREYMPATLS